MGATFSLPAASWDPPASAERTKRSREGPAPAATTAAPSRRLAAAALASAASREGPMEGPGGWGRVGGMWSKEREDTLSSWRG